MQVVNDGALAIPRLMGFRKMVQLTSNREWVVAALKRAPLVELCHGDGAVRAVRRYTAQEARETALLPEEIPAKLEDQDHALLQCT
jgi:hypothetical protein